MDNGKLNDSKNIDVMNTFEQIYSENLKINRFLTWMNQLRFNISSEYS